jgi:dihydroorotate dehydrogenase
LGFGHIAVGTVTQSPQSGNLRPRVWRVPEAQAVINALGFPSEGVARVTDHVTRAQSHSPHSTRIGINIGKGKDTPLERAAEDYCALLKHAHGCADYVTVNVSSPNTLNLRQLQARAAMEALLLAIASVRQTLIPRVPVLVKLAPDLTEAELDDALAAITTSGMDGIIATNTTIHREGLPRYATTLTGGLSGAPLRTRATEVVRYLARQTSLPIVGVGGIMSADDALERLDAGACLIQVYTGLVYAGPGLVKAINRTLLQRARNMTPNSETSDGDH